MSNMEIVDALEKQHAALMHLACTCEDNGLAMCLENVADQLTMVCCRIPRTCSPIGEGKRISDAVIEGMWKVLDDWKKLQSTSQQSSSQ